MRAVILIALAAAGACSQPGAPGDVRRVEEEVAATEPETAVNGPRRNDVYIAFAPQRDSASMLAMSGGRLEVVDNCLVLRSELAIHVPVFTPSADTFVTDTAVVIAGKAVPLGTEIQTAGGEMGIDADSVLEQPRPARCRHRLLRVSSWGVPGR